MPGACRGAGRPSDRRQPAAEPDAGDDGQDQQRRPPPGQHEERRHYDHGKKDQGEPRSGGLRRRDDEHDSPAPPLIGTKPLDDEPEPPAEQPGQEHRVPEQALGTTRGKPHTGDRLHQRDDRVEADDAEQDGLDGRGRVAT